MSSVPVIFFPLLSFCASCGSEQGSQTETTKGNESDSSTDTEEPRIYPEIPEGVDFGGYEFRIFGYKGGYTEHLSRI